jgi:hypothetical protein
MASAYSEIRQLTLFDFIENKQIATELKFIDNFATQKR